MTLEFVQTQAAPKPPRIIYYAPPGIGKTTLLAAMPNPIVLQTEDGSGGIDVDHTPLAESFDQVIGWLNELGESDHSYQTLGIDSPDWLEPLIHAKVCQDQKVDSIEDIGYGKGYIFAMDYWRKYVHMLNALRDYKGMAIAQAAHHEIKRFDDPTTDGYDRYQMKMHKGASALLQEHSDAVLFMNYRVGVTKEDKGFNATRKRAIGTGERIIYTQERPAFAAKNRYGMPSEITLKSYGNGATKEQMREIDRENWQSIAQYIPYYQ